MRIKLKRLQQAVRAYRCSGNLGDFALLKADAFRIKPNREIAVEMKHIRGSTLQIDLDKLILLPEGTFSREYVLYMQDKLTCWLLP